MFVRLRYKIIPSSVTMNRWINTLFVQRWLFKGGHVSPPLPVVMWLLCLLCLTAPFASAEDTKDIISDNHFQTREKLSQPEKPQQRQIDPLTAYPVAQYVVHGVIVAADNAVAVVYSPRNTWHRLQVRAQLGQEQAIIRQITTKGIQIEIQNTLSWLPLLQ